jgi:hypothetical protein
MKSATFFKIQFRVAYFLRKIQFYWKRVGVAHFLRKMQLIWKLVSSCTFLKDKCNSYLKLIGAAHILRKMQLTLKPIPSCVLLKDKCNLYWQHDGVVHFLWKLKTHVEYRFLVAHFCEKSAIHMNNPLFHRVAQIHFKKCNSYQNQLFIAHFLELVKLILKSLECHISWGNGWLLSKPDYYLHVYWQKCYSLRPIYFSQIQMYLALKCV